MHALVTHLAFGVERSGFQITPELGPAGVASLDVLLGVLKELVGDFRKEKDVQLVVVDHPTVDRTGWGANVVV